MGIDSRDQTATLDFVFQSAAAAGGTDWNELRYGKHGSHTDSQWRKAATYVAKTFHGCGYAVLQRYMGRSPSTIKQACMEFEYALKSPNEPFRREHRDMIEAVLYCMAPRVEAPANPAYVLCGSGHRGDLFCVDHVPDLGDAVLVDAATFVVSSVRESAGGEMVRSVVSPACTACGRLLAAPF